MKGASLRNRIAAQLADLKMPGALEALDEVFRSVDGGGCTAGEAIERLLGAQGPPGVGKTHIAISLAVAAAEAGRRIYFGTLAALIESLEEAHAAGRLKTLMHPALLVVDEIGYLPVTSNGARMFFQLINGRYGRASTVLTSNKPYQQWGEVLHDEVMAAALLDRLLHRSHTINIRGNSYRMRRHKEISRAIHPSAAAARDGREDTHTDARRGGGGS